MAVMIIFIAVGAVIEISSNTKHMFETLKNQKNFNLLSSIPLIERKNRKNLYEEAIDFNITDDALISYLKKQKINLDTSIDYTMELNTTEDKKATLFVNKYEAYNERYSNHVYGIEVK
jgi:hypothetical protein